MRDRLALAERWLFAPGDPRRLAALRIGLCLVLAVRAARPVLLSFAGQPEALFRPLSFMRLLPRMPGRELTTIAQAIAIAASLAAAAGIRSRITLPIAWACAVLLFGMETSLGKVVHHDLLPILALIPLLPAATDDAWSLTRRRPVLSASLRAGWPVRTAGLLVAGSYLFAGLAKLAFSGPAWVFGDNMRNLLYISSDTRGGNAVALFIADRALLAHAVAGAVLFFELTVWVALVRPRLAPVYAVATAAVHGGIWLAMGLDYSAWAATVVVVLIDWPALVEGTMLRRTVRLVPASPTLGGVGQHALMYDQDCGFCRWSVERILRSDRRGLLRAIPIQGSEGERLLANLDLHERLASWHLQAPDGRRWSAGAAVAPLARLLPWGAPVAWLATTFPGLTERAYRWIALNRDRLGRRLGERACAVDPSASGNGTTSG